MTKDTKRLVLASASPRRQAFLRDLGLDFAVVPADIDETPAPDEDPVTLAARLASSKAAAVAARVQNGAVVIAADTVVALGRTLLGKPEDDGDASRMLRALRGKAHEVHSAVSVLDTTNGWAETVVNSTEVWMRDYSDDEVAVYVASGDPLDKAGAYAIQHPTFNPASALSGCLSGVMGLPLEAMRTLLARAGVAVPSNIVAVCELQTHFTCCQRQR